MRWMRRQRVDSESVVSAGFEPGDRTLEIEFVNGGVYRYFDVPVAVWNAFQRADSKGRFVNFMVKPNYRFERVDD